MDKNIDIAVTRYLELIRERFAHIEGVYLFGSYARGEQTSESDIDLLVELREPIGMFKFLDLEEYLETIFNKKIDLGTPNSLKPYVKDSILKEAIAL